MLPTTPQAQLPMIAGHTAGIQVRCTPQAKPVYDNLLLKARQGNH